MENFVNHSARDKSPPGRQLSRTAIHILSTATHNPCLGLELNCMSTPRSAVPCQVHKRTLFISRHFFISNLSSGDPEPVLLPPEHCTDMADVDGNGKPNSSDGPNEFSSLIPRPVGYETTRQRNNDGMNQMSRSPQAKGAFLEFWILFKGAAPVILAYMLQMSLQTITVVVVGHSSPQNLAVAAFSMMFAAVTGWMIALGGTTALDTLASSAFTGSESKQDLGILLQRAFLVFGIFYIPIAIIWAFSNPIFLALGQNPEISYQSSRFLTALIPGGLGYIYFETMKKYLQAQGRYMSKLPCFFLLPLI